MVAIKKKNPPDNNKSYYSLNTYQDLCQVLSIYSFLKSYKEGILPFPLQRGKETKKHSATCTKPHCKEAAEPDFELRRPSSYQTSSHPFFFNSSNDG